ncbi:uncharacterized protein C3orf38 homolog [Clarias gariepinus]|uniref:uncharacterized protein C3orf38 homolog n=1 Tax=Clarias gariepinus TaxID=13013 RepID=UPI00234D4E33|nr:uncharacterized protein C3orf38 homolog [Clarias gariepinus]
MSALSKRESEGCRKLLTLLSVDDLLALSDTVTNRLIPVASSGEAIEAIIAYSQSAEELLKRKKVHRDVIFKYLATEKVVLPAASDKHQLVKRTLEFWSSDSKKSQNTVNATSACCTEQTGDGSADLTALGKQFCQWFFQLLNSQNPQASQPVQDWGPQHFWSDAKLLLCSHTQTEEFFGAELVSKRLFALTWEERLLFCPNLELRGLKCVSTAHGLVLVAVAGTIHRESDCLGIFEQVFGLIRASLDESRWKIKFMHLKIKGQIIKERLPEVTYDSKELTQLFT